MKAGIKPGLGVIGLLIIATLLAAMPLAAQAQEPPPQVFVGIARVNGFPVAVDTPITAWVGDQKIGETTAIVDGEFVLLAFGGEGVLSFRIGELPADQRVPWLLGDVTRGFILTTNYPADPCFTIPKGATAFAEVDQPFQEIVGKATVNELPAPPGTPITAWDISDDNQRQIGYALTGAEGNFTLKITQFSDPFRGIANFRIGKMPAAETYYSENYSGEAPIGFNLTAKPATGPCLGWVSGMELDELLEDKFIRAFTFDNAAKQWLFYDPLAGDANTLKEFISGRAYFILVSESVGVSLNGKYHNLSCVAGNCWNLIVW